MEERKRSNVVRLALLGVVAGGVGLTALSSGTPVQRNRYASLEECKADYTEAQCNSDTPVDSSRSGVVTRSYYGPWYRSDYATRSDPSDPGPGRRYTSGGIGATASGFAGGGSSGPSNVEHGSRGGFGHSGRVRAASS